MYLCGDYESWDQRSLMIGMMGGMGGMGGGMGGMGGGMGGMGGGMGGMGGGMGMMSVPPTSLPFADLKAEQTRNLPTRLVSLSQPDPDSETGVSFPAQGEKLQLGDVSQINGDARGPESPQAAGRRQGSRDRLAACHVEADLGDRTGPRSSSSRPNGPMPTS